MADMPVETPVEVVPVEEPPKPPVARKAAKKAAKPAAKAMSKSQVAGTLAEKVGITKKQSVAYLEELSRLALKEAKNGFTLPGLGKVVLVRTKARKIKVPFGEHAGEIRTIPAQKKLRFRFAKPAKDTVLGKK